MVLSDTWFMEGYIDFELQKYRLLAYLQEVKKDFNESRLYPKLADLVYHYNNLLAFRTKKQSLKDSFPQKLETISLKRMELVYEQMLKDDNIMQELDAIMQFAANQFDITIRKGAEIYEFVENKLIVEPVGIVPLYKNEGYVFFHLGFGSEVRIYNYTITLFEHRNSRYKGIRMEYVEQAEKGIVNTYETLKIDLTRRFRTLPNPAVYLIDYPQHIPLDETLLPIAKRLLVKVIDDAPMI